MIPLKSDLKRGSRLIKLMDSEAIYWQLLSYSLDTFFIASLSKHSLIRPGVQFYLRFVLLRIYRTRF